MPRFRRYRNSTLRYTGGVGGSRRIKRLLAKPVTSQDRRRWEALHRECVDGGSRIRLDRLIHRLGSRDRGVQESALAEIELATLLLRVGASVRFLPESQARSADLECRFHQERFFIEVTAMVGALTRSRQSLRRLPLTIELEEEQPGIPGNILMQAILARVRQKAKQLTHYREPVLLAISIPRLDDGDAPNSRQEAVLFDIKQLIGALTVLLPGLPHLSGVLIALWDIEPLPSRSGVRLGNVLVVERSQQQSAYPGVRMLVMNPSADHPLQEHGTTAMRQLL